MELDTKDVRKHFEGCLQLLFRYASHEDSQTILVLLNDQLCLFQEF